MQKLVMGHATKFVKYAIVGGIATLLDLLLLWFFTEIAGIYYLVSATLAFILASVFNYSLSRKYVFNSKNGNIISEYTSFVIIGVIGLVLTVALLALFVEVFGIYYLLARVIVAFISLLWNYALNALVTFKR